MTEKTEKKQKVVLSINHTQYVMAVEQGLEIFRVFNLGGLERYETHWNPDTKKVDTYVGRPGGVEVELKYLSEEDYAMGKFNTAAMQKAAQSKGE